MKKTGTVMKAFKGCINIKCYALKRIHDQGEYNYCPYYALNV